AGKVIKREQDYFAGHAKRMNYSALHRKGWPIGSGPVESECRNRQCRFKRPGQNWTPRGMRNLGALTEARQNGHWDQFWECETGPVSICTRLEANRQICLYKQSGLCQVAVNPFHSRGRQMNRFLRF